MPASALVPDLEKHPMTRGLLLSLILVPSLALAQVQVILPKSAPAPVGPYSPGVFAGDYLYVSGQGARAPDGTMPADFESQVRQALDNVKAVVEAAGLTMENIVYTHAYLDDINNFDAMNRVYRTYFPGTPPARATLGVAKLPGTPVEFNAVAIRDASQKKAVTVPGYDPGEPASAGILTNDRLFISGMRGRSLAEHKVPDDAGQQVSLALEGVKAVVEAAGLKMANVVFVNPYLTSSIPARVMNELYAKQFEFGNTPGRATIQVASLPQGAQIEFTGVAARDLAQRHAVRPKNMAPSPTASPCVFVGDTFYCSAKSGFIPGINGGVFAASVDHQLRQTMRNLLDNLEEAGLDFTNVVATNVYLNDIGDFAGMNKTYAKYFKGIAPARTTVQQVVPVKAEPNAEGVYPTLEQISLIAVRQK
jgi:reactive intermediate/imine deaminase